ncbi:MAG: tetratricopeptide repeat protein [Burkholderiales bacterium]|nr:tetratricopeptide repeat protein [Burkholderiales bacterium]
MSTTHKVQWLAALGQAKALASKPGQPPETVETAFQRALALSQEHHEVLAAYGEYLRAQGRAREALALLQPHLNAQASFDLAFTLGNAAAAISEFKTAQAAYRQACDSQPSHAMAHNNLGYVCNMQGLFEEAYLALTEALVLNPGLALAMGNLIDLLIRKKDWPEAEKFVDALVEMTPTGHAYFQRGKVLNAVGRLSEARSSWLHALTLNDQDETTHIHLGGLYYKTGEVLKAQTHFLKALNLNPKNPTNVSNYLLSLNYLYMDPAFVFAEHQRAAAFICPPQANDTNLNQRLQTLRQLLSKAPAKLHLAFLSSDFYEHPVGQLIEATLMQWPEEQANVTCLHRGTESDGLTTRLRAQLGEHRFLDCSTWDSARFQTEIKQRDIHVLIELSGHTGNSYLSLFKQRLAPLQATYLGYPNTTGIASIDYRITDTIADPIGHTEAFHSEQLLRICAPFVLLQKPRTVQAMQYRAPKKDGSFLFGCFNNLPKLTDETLRAWAVLLNACPNARLLLKAGGLADAAIQAEFRERLTLLGLPADRVDLKARTGFEQHLALYRSVDLALDPFPYNGTATTIEALWCNVPLLTLAGNTHVARVGASIMESLQMPQLVAQTVESYIAKAQAFYNNPQALDACRQHLAQTLPNTAASNAARISRELIKVFSEVIHKS